MTDRDSRDEVRRELGELGYDDTMSASQTAFEADLSAVHADDALLDALGGSDPKIADGLGDQELNALLLAWRRDIDSEPLAELVDTDTAVTTIKTAALARKHGQRTRNRRFLWPVAAAAAVLAIAFTGTSIAARDAQPGDALWGLTKVLYADHARSVEAASAARSDLQQASIALSQGKIAEAQQALAEAAAKLSQVSAEDNLAQLMQEHQQLSQLLQNPGQTTQQPTTTQQPAPPPPQSSSSSTPTTTPSPTTSTSSAPPSTSDSSSSSAPPPTTESSSSASGGDGTGSTGSSIRYDPGAGAGTAGATGN
ncbi:anti-sigma-D factor RsdA [Amycolatopsis sp.]|uniref:anti-sigma-D factor RsdA n=1 Tax=Amycolatopsis sp. TaxID=37632 RepID=UPI002CA2FD85|nr:anti-sigma-D factor RsdA [Amycolatopsis sp.]HVV14225.1 anti-sigma-D factor RsdA [Amycolatopsis sp.]